MYTKIYYMLLVLFSYLFYGTNVNAQSNTQNIGPVYYNGTTLKIESSIKGIEKLSSENSELFKLWNEKNLEIDFPSFPNNLQTKDQFGNHLILKDAKIHEEPDWSDFTNYNSPELQIILQRIDPFLKPVELDEAIGSLKKDLLKKNNQLAIRNLLTSSEVARQSNCTAPVKKIKRNFATDHGYRNMLENYKNYCIKANENFRNCLSQYKKISKYCFSDAFDISQKNKDKRYDFGGILVVTIGDNPSSSTILCSSTILSDYRIITSAHCIREFSYLASITKDAKLFFHPYSANWRSNSFLISHAKFSSNLEELNITNPKFFKENSPEEDIAILRTDSKMAKTGIDYKYPKLSLPDDVSRVSLIGYQLMVSRATKLASLVDQNIFPTDEMLIQSGTWKLSFVADSTPTCVLIDLPKAYKAKNLLGHMCQSLGGTSGAAIWKFDSASKSLEIVAIHRGSAKQVIPSKIVEAVQARNIAVKLNASLIKNFQN